MKTFMMMMAALFCSVGLFAQQDDNLVCRVKKSYAATYVHKQNETKLIKTGELYPVLGTAGKMVVIKVGSKSYFTSAGSIDIFQVKPKSNSAKNDTLPFAVEKVGKWE